jgi:hypothetical protein
MPMTGEWPDFTSCAASEEATRPEPRIAILVICIIHFLN